ncbi:MAG TPA: 4-(cytidine 5'-diphospho)-2-C-methyl-D-erythritol kinase [Bacteroidia bacterium]|nr:4-(cytidine 5'-diphospho)-2-C-methyl-D-erythritol kinase [Bacteroidia bacterium]
MITFASMIVYPNAKINLGLNVVEKRPDGFHNIETVFYPVNWNDVLEILPDETKDRGVTFSSSGIAIPGAVEENLCVRAYNLISGDYPMPAIKVHLHKIIPIGAGLGGGSSDAAFFIKAINKLFELNLAWGELHHYAKQLGADCSFFITNKPVFAEGKGDQLESTTVSLNGYYCAIVFPGVHVNTSDAYTNVTPHKPEISLEELIVSTPIPKWKDVLKNDFEKNIFKKFPMIGEMKKKMYQSGAVYSGMSGSGSAVYGIFEKEISLADVFKGNLLWQGEF